MCDGFSYKWLIRFRTNAYILQLLVLCCTYRTGPSSDSYDNDSKWERHKLRSIFEPPTSFWPLLLLPCADPFPDPFFMYYLHKRIIKLSSGNEVLLWYQLLQFETTIFLRLGGMRLHSLYCRTLYLVCLRGWAILSWWEMDIARMHSKFLLHDVGKRVRRIFLLRRFFSTLWSSTPPPPPSSLPNCKLI